MKPYEKMLVTTSRCLSSAVGGGSVDASMTSKKSYKAEEWKKEADTTGQVERTSVTAGAGATTSWSVKEKKGKVIPPRPNYFVAIPVNGLQIKEKLKEVQQALVDGDEKLKKALVSLDKTHITLSVLLLEGEEQIKCASTALATAAENMKSKGLNEIKLNFEGLGTFENEVLFAKILEDGGFEKLSQTAEIVRTALVEAGLLITDGRAFNAHLTIAKLSKGRGNKYSRKDLKKIDACHYHDFVNTIFGEEQCYKLQLLAMAKTDKLTGYYHCESEAVFSAEQVQSSEDLASAGVVSPK